MVESFRRLPFFLMAEWTGTDVRRSLHIYVSFVERILTVGETYGGRDSMGAFVAAAEMVEKWGWMLEDTPAAWLRPHIDRLADPEAGNGEPEALAEYAARHHGAVPRTDTFGVPWHLGVSRRDTGPTSAPSAE
jgi:hypothetical protein